MTIALGSTNPVKIEAVRFAVAQYKESVEVVGAEVESGVSHQPMTDEETKQGALNRATRALQKIKAADLGFGLEGGVEEASGGLLNTVWACIIDKQGNTTFANGERFLLPNILATPIRNGEEMDPAIDHIIGETHINQKQGMIGVVTEGYLHRAEIYGSLAKLVFGLWVGRNWEKSIQV